MEISEYQNIYANEESHFFYVTLHRLILKLIDRYRPKKNLRILDAGCGTGGLMKKMAGYGKVSGVDFSSEAIKFAKKRRLDVRIGSVTQLPFEANTFDVVTCIDVLYHRDVVDDVKALMELKRVLKKGGIMIIRVQADKSLKTAHDRFVHSKRRYILGELSKKIKAAGLAIEMISYFHSPLWPIAKLKVWKEKLEGRKKSKSGVEPTNVWINSALTWVLDHESGLILNGFRPRVGLGIVTVAKKV